MPGAERADGPHDISHGDQSYPDRLILRLGPDAPKRIVLGGSTIALSVPMTAFLCSKETPGATILKAFDQAAAWREAGRCVISGFHSPLEQDERTSAFKRDQRKAERPRLRCQADV